MRRRVRSVLKFVRDWLKPVIVAGWLGYMSYLLGSGLISSDSAWERLTSSEIVTAIFGVL